MIDFQLHCFGISYRDASVETRERLRFTLFDIRALLASTRQSPRPDGMCPFASIQEMVLLSTCNRIELYVRTDDEVPSPRTMLSELILEASSEARKRAGLPPEDDTHFTPEILREITYHHEGIEVARHLARVACALDSMVLGETQILSQIKAAQESARESGLIGPVLSAVFRSAHRAGKHARSRTKISSNPSSVSTAAVALAKQDHPDLAQCDVSVLGLGEMGQLALKTLHARHARRLRLINRTHERAEALAGHISHNTGTDCIAQRLEELPKVLKETDLLVTAAGGSGWLIDADTARKAVEDRGGKILTIVDIGVPRNVDPEVAKIDGLHLFDMDSIQAVQDEAIEARRREIPKVMALIDEEMDRLRVTLRKLRIRPLIDELRQKAEAIRQHELERTYHKLGSPDPETWEHVQRLSAALVKKLFHDPTMCMQEKAALESADAYAATIRELFGLKKNG